MEDKTLPPEGLSGALQTFDRSERRAFLRRAVAVGVPVVLATVRGRSVLAQGPDDTVNGSGCGSASPSGWLKREDPAARKASCDAFESSGASQPTQPQGAPIDLTPPEDTHPGKGNGKGGGKK
jgi:hypothetical protein